MKYLAILLLLFAIHANATGKPEPPDEPTTQTQTQDQSMDQYQSAVSEGSTATGGNAEATGGTAAAAGGNVEEINLKSGDVSISNKRPYRNTPNAYGPSIYPTVPCYKGASGSASAPGFGLSIGAGKIDPGCNDREWVRTSPESHKLFVFCSTDYMKGKFPSVEDCLDYVPRETKEAMPDEAGVERSGPEVYDDTALTQQIEALVARVGAVETKTTQTRTLAKESQEYAVAASSPFQDMQAELRRIVRVEK